MRGGARVSSVVVPVRCACRSKLIRLNNRPWQPVGLNPHPTTVGNRSFPGGSFGNRNLFGRFWVGLIFLNTMSITTFRFITAILAIVFCATAEAETTGVVTSKDDQGQSYSVQFYGDLARKENLRTLFPSARMPPVRGLNPSIFVGNVGYKNV